MKNKIDVYTPIGGALCAKYEVSTAPLSEEEQKRNPFIVLSTEAYDRVRSSGGYLFVRDNYCSKCVRESGWDYRVTVRPYRPDYLVALLKDVVAAYTSAAFHVYERIDSRAGIKVYVRLSRRVAFGVAGTLSALGIDAYVTVDRDHIASDETFVDWRRVVVNVMCTKGCVHFSFDPLSVLRQRLAIYTYRIQNGKVVAGHDVLRYHERGTNYMPVLTFDNLFKDEVNRVYEVRRDPDDPTSVIQVDRSDYGVRMAMQRWGFVEGDPMDFDF